MATGKSYTHLILPAAAAILFGGSILPGITRSASAHATKPLPRVTITGKVLLGNAKSFHSVGVVDRRAVFESIPAIKSLRMERVPRDGARYHFLVYEANRRFQRAVERAAAEGNVDLIVESGGVSAAGIDVADLTDLTRSMLGREP